MNRRSVVLAVFAALLMLPGLALAAQRGGGDPAAILHNPRLLARYLKLTPDQVEKQKALLADLKEEVQPLREQQQPLREDLRDLLEAANPSANEVGNLVIQIDALGDDIREAIADYDDAFSAILTPEQLAKYEALKELVASLRGGNEED